MWSTGEGNGKPLKYSCLENPMNSMKRQNDRIQKEELHRSVGAQYATGDQWKNNSRQNEGMEPKQKQHTVADVTGDISKVRCCKEQYCTGTCNVRSMNQCKLEVVKQEMGRRQWHPTPVLSPGKSHGWRSLVGCSPWGQEELDTTERLHFHFSLHALEKEMATHSSVLSWRIPGMGEPGGLLSMGLHRVGHD